MPNRCPACGRFCEVDTVDAVIDLDRRGGFVAYCSWTCCTADSERLRGEEPDIIY
jgi:hypothetical protein